MKNRVQTLPVVVEMAQLEREQLQLVWLQIGFVADDVVCHWCHCALVDCLGNHVEIVTEITDGFVESLTNV